MSLNINSLQCSISSNLQSGLNTTKLEVGLQSPGGKSVGLSSDRAGEEQAQQQQQEDERKKKEQQAAKAKLDAEDEARKKAKKSSKYRLASPKDKLFIW